MEFLRVKHFFISLLHYFYYTYIMIHILNIIVDMELKQVNFFQTIFD